MFFEFLLFRFGAPLGAILEPFWNHLGAILGQLATVLGPLVAGSGQDCGHLRLIEGCLKASLMLVDVVSLHYDMF